MPSALVCPPGSGESNQAFGLPRQFLIAASETGDAFSLFREHVPPSAGPPLHVHHREHETFAVLEGEIRFHCEGEETTLGPGGVVSIPPGARHTFRNDGSSTAVVLVTFTPGGADGFFREVEAAGLEAPQDLEQIAEIGVRYGLEFVGPPLS